MSNNSEKQGLHKSVINWYPGHMAKTKREISEKLSLIDIVYEVIDARMPISSKIVDIDNLIKDKPRILVVTKYDLCDKEETDKILKLYEQKSKVIKIDLIKENVSGIVSLTKELMVPINEKRKNQGMKERPARVLVLGVPNVGKSTLINRLVGRKSTSVGNRPGITKNLNWIRINKDIELLDTPGILWPKLENQESAHILASFSSIKEEILNTSDIAIFILRKLYELYPDKLKLRYGIEKLDDDYIEAYDMIAKKRNVLSRGGITDYDKVSNIIIKDLKDGLIENVTFDRLNCDF